jgi:hypothetical protein
MLPNEHSTVRDQLSLVVTTVGAFSEPDASRFMQLGGYRRMNGAAKKLRPERGRLARGPAPFTIGLL